MSAFVVFVKDNLSGLFVYCFLGIFDMEEKLSLNGGYTDRYCVITRYFI